MTLRWTLWSLASPSQLLLLALMLGPLLWAMGRARAGRIVTLLGAVGLFFLGVLPTSHYLTAALESRFPQPELPARVTGIILLAGSERPTASQAHGEPQAGRSGGPLSEPGKGPLETQPAVARAFFADSGLPMQRLTFDEGFPDTGATPANVKRLVQSRPGETWVAVTSAIHMPRTIACFRAAGWGDIVAQPADFRVTLG